MVGQDRRPSFASRRAGLSSFLVFLLLFASYRPAVCLIGMFSLDLGAGGSSSRGIADSSRWGGAHPTPTRQQSRTDPELRSTLSSTSEERASDPRPVPVALPRIAEDGAALCVPVAIRLGDVTSRPTYLRPDDHPRPRPLAPPA